MVTAYYAAVIDGATPKTDFRYASGETPGHAAARLLSHAIAQLPPEATAQEAIALLEQVLHCEDVAPANRPTASLVIYSVCRREVWAVGDCQFATASSNGFETFSCPKQIDLLLSQWRSDIIRSYLCRGLMSEAEILAHDPGRRIIQPHITQQVRYQNLEAEHPLAYGVMDGEHVPSRFIRVQKIAPEVEQLILASDGYPELLPSLSASEQRLQTLLSEDPLCIGPLRGTKGLRPGNLSFDDRTYLRLEL